MKIKPVIVEDLEYRLSRASCELINEMNSGAKEPQATAHIAEKWSVTIESLREEAKLRLFWLKRIADEAPKEQE